MKNLDSTKKNNFIFTILVLIAISAIGFSVLTSTNSTVSASDTLISLSDHFDAREGSSVLINWEPENYSQYEFAALIIAPDIEDENTWDISYQDLSNLREGSFFLSAQAVRFQSAQVGWVPIGVDGIDNDTISWSDPIYKDENGIYIGVPTENTQFQGGFVAQTSNTITSPNAQNRCHLYFDTEIANDCGFGSNFWSHAPYDHTNRIGGLVGYHESSSLFFGAYTRSVPNAEGNPNSFDARNPYGFGFCSRTEAGSTSTGLVQVNTQESFWDDATFPGSTVSRRAAANAILAHYGNPELWAIDPATGFTIFNWVQGNPNYDYVEQGDGLRWNGVNYRPEDRLAAVHIAMRDLLTDNYSYAAIPGSGNETIIQLAQRFMEIHAGTRLVPNVTPNHNPPDSFNFRGYSLRGNTPLELKVDDRFFENGLDLSTGEVHFRVTGDLNALQNAGGNTTAKNNVPLVGVPVTLIHERNGADFEGLAGFSGEASATHYNDLYNYDGNGLGKVFTNEDGVAVFTSNAIIEGNQRISVAAETTPELPEVWRGATGTQENVTTSGPIRVVTWWNLRDTCEDGSCVPYVLIEKFDQDGRALEGAEFRLTRWTTTDTVRFALYSHLGKLPTTNQVNLNLARFLSGEEDVRDIINRVNNFSYYQNNSGQLGRDAYINFRYETLLGRSPNSGEMAQARSIFNGPNGRAELTFTLYSLDEAKEYLASQFALSETITTGTTNRNGRLGVIVPPGFVSVEETKAPAGYEILNERDGGLIVDGTLALPFENIGNAEVIVRTINAYTGAPIANRRVNLRVNGDTITNAANTGSAGEVSIPSQHINPSGGNMSIQVQDFSNYIVYDANNTKTISYKSGDTTYVDFYYYSPPTISTQASAAFIQIPEGAGVGQIVVSDEITVNNLPSNSIFTKEGQIIDLEISLYGPYPIGTPLTRDASYLHSTQTLNDLTSPSGNTLVVDSPNFTVTQEGQYTFWVEGTVTDYIVDQTNTAGNHLLGEQPDIVTHDFGITSETFLVREGKNITTEAWTPATGQEFVIESGETFTISDSIIINDLFGPNNGAPGEPAEIEVILHGPYETREALLADTSPVVTSETPTEIFSVEGTNSNPDIYQSPDFQVTETGWYVFEVNGSFDLDGNGSLESIFSHENYRNDDRETFFLQEQVEIFGLKLGESQISGVDFGNEYLPLENVVINVLQKNIDQSGIESFSPALDLDGNPIQVTTDANGAVSASVIPGHQYCFQEVSPPQGFTLDNIPRCTPGEVLQSMDTGSPVLIINDRPELIPTGFNLNQLQILGSILAFAGALFVGFGISVRKDEEQDNKQLI